MQELRSTEILDKEIEADARRKAEAILKKADEECAQIMEGVKTKLDFSRSEKENFYSEKLAAVEKDIAASIPLEKQRFEVAFVQERLIMAVNKYLAELSQEKKLELVAKNFDFSSCSGKKLDAYVYGFNKDSVKAFLDKKLADQKDAVLVSCSQTEFGKIVVEDEIGLEKNEGFILESQDKSFRARMTMIEVVSRLLDKYRAELSRALLDESNLGGAE